MVKRNEVINACGMSLEYLSCNLICPWLSLGLKLGESDKEGRWAEQPDFRMPCRIIYRYSSGIVRCGEMF